jgi:hypothetical protein
MTDDCSLVEVPHDLLYGVEGLFDPLAIDIQMRESTDALPYGSHLYCVFRISYFVLRRWVMRDG